MIPRFPSAISAIMHNLGSVPTRTQRHMQKSTGTAPAPIMAAALAPSMARPVTALAACKRTRSSGDDSSLTTVGMAVGMRLLDSGTEANTLARAAQADSWTSTWLTSSSGMSSGTTTEGEEERRGQSRSGETPGSPRTDHASTLERKHTRDECNSTRDNSRHHPREVRGGGPHGHGPPGGQHVPEAGHHATPQSGHHTRFKGRYQGVQGLSGMKPGRRMAQQLHDRMDGSGCEECCLVVAPRIGLFVQAASLDARKVDLKIRRVRWQRLHAVDQPEEGKNRARQISMANCNRMPTAKKG